MAFNKIVSMLIVTLLITIILHTNEVEGVNNREEEFAKLAKELRDTLSGYDSCYKACFKYEIEKNPNKEECNKFCDTSCKDLEKAKGDLKKGNNQ